MSELPEGDDTRSNVGRVLQTSVLAGCNAPVPDFLERDPSTELLREGTGDQSAGPRLRVSASEPPAHLHVVGTNRRVPAVTFTQLTHPPTKPLVAHPDLAHNCC
ncbi:MAG TPA: hypothetical protein VGP04_19640 [Pseudonocardiaceae bacterium]|nr:hypothetical protein [Pseudonocardiaceae bacterium]